MDRSLKISHIGNTGFDPANDNGSRPRSPTTMGQIRRRFSVEFKRDVVLQIESGELRVSEASHNAGKLYLQVLNTWLATRDEEFWVQPRGRKKEQQHCSSSDCLAQYFPESHASIHKWKHENEDHDSSSDLCQFQGDDNSTFHVVAASYQSGHGAATKMDGGNRSAFFANSSGSFLIATSH